MAFRWKFAKYHGLGNDFLCGPDGPGFTVARVKALCHRQRGVGADGLMLVGKVKQGAFPCRILNADGSPATFSGNGIRCAAEWLFDSGAAAGSVQLLPPAGLVTVRRGRGLASLLTFRVSALRRQEEPLEDFEMPRELGTLAAPGLHVVLGNPHVVFLVPDADGLTDSAVRACDELRKPSRWFPDAVNVSVVSAMGGTRWRHRTWERGVGLSPSCASAACAALFGLSRRGLLPAAVSFRQDGGEVKVRLRGEEMTLEGPIERAFRGEV